MSLSKSEYTLSGIAVKKLVTKKNLKSLLVEKYKKKTKEIKIKDLRDRKMSRAEPQVRLATIESDASCVAPSLLGDTCNLGSLPQCLLPFDAENDSVVPQINPLTTNVIVRSILRSTDRFLQTLPEVVLFKRAYPVAYVNAVVCIWHAFELVFVPNLSRTSALYEDMFEDCMLHLSEDVHVINHHLSFDAASDLVNEMAEFLSDLAESHDIELIARVEPQVFEVEHGISSEVTECIEELSSSLKNVNVNFTVDNDMKELLTKALSSLEKLKSLEHKVDIGMNVTSFMTQLMGSFPEIIVVVLAIVMIIMYYQGRIMNKVGFGVFVGWLVARYSCFESLSCFFGGNEVVPQVGIDVEQVSDLITGLLNAYLFAGSKITDVKAVSMLISTISRTGNGIKPMIDAMNQILVFVQTIISKYLLNDVNAFILTGHPFIDEYIGEFERVKLDFENKVLFSNNDSLDKVRLLISRGEKLSLKIPSDRKMLSLRFRINESVSQLEKIKKALLATNFKFNGLRQEPTSIMFRGSPGVGKSNCMQHIAHALAARTFSDEDRELYKKQPALFTYNRQAENIYWEGMDATKRMIFFDDILQARDVAGNPDNELMNLIRAINVFENQLHVANIDGKGNTTLRSDFIFATSNSRNYNFESINEPGAFLRRWDIVVDVCPKAEFCIDSNQGVWERKLDPSKLPISWIDGVDVTSLRPEFLEFHLTYLDTENKQFSFLSTGIVFSFDQLVDHAENIFRRKTSWHVLNLRDLNLTFEHNVQAQADVEPQAGGSSQLPPPMIPLQQPLAFFEEQRLRTRGTRNLYVYLAKKEFLRYGLYDMEDYLYRYFDENYDGTTRVLPELAVINYIDNILPPRCLKPVASYLRVAYDKIYATCSVLDDVRSRLFKLFKTICSFLSPEQWRRYFAGTTVDADIITKYANAGTSVMSLLLLSSACVSFIMHSLRADAKAYRRGVVKYENEPREPAGTVGAEPGSNERATRMKRSRVPIRRVPVAPQSLQNTTSNITDIIKATAKKSMYEFWVPSETSDGATKLTNYGWVLALKGRSILFPYHFMSTIVHYVQEEGVDASLNIEMRRVAAGSETFLISIDEFLSCWEDNLKYEKSDLAFLRLPIRFPPHRDISSRFVEEKILKFYTMVSSVLYLPSVNADKASEIVNTIAEQSLHEMNVDGPNFDAYTIDRTFSYDAPTSVGDCGSLLFSVDNRRGARILGMHVAGISGRRIGYASILTREMIDDILTVLGEDYEVDDQLSISLEEDVTFRDNVVSEGAVPKEYVSHSTGTSKISRSCLHGTWKPSLREPAKLRPFRKDGVWLDPMKKVSDKYCRGDVPIPLDVIQEASSSLQDYIRRNEKIKLDKNVMTFDEAVLGDGTDFWHSIPRVTSAGFPYTSLPGLKTRERFFGTGEEYDLDNPASLALRSSCDDVIEKAKRGVRSNHVFVDFLKDETRSISKVLDGDTRMISSGPTELLICSRMYFGAWQRSILSNGIDTGVCVGVNEYSTDWDRIARILSSVGGTKSIGAGDFKGFDMCQIPRILYAILDIINEWYGDEEGNRVRSILWLELVNSRHLQNRNIFAWASSLPSGHPLTIFVNCLYVMIVFRVCWIYHFGSCSTFNENCRLAVTGDDNVYGVSKRANTFTELVVQRNMALLGLNYTPEVKSLEVCDDSLRSILDVTFLKRRFVKDNITQRYIAPLDLDVILEIPFWIRKGANTNGDVEVNVRISFEELSLHEKSVFEYWKGRILDALSRTSIRPPFNTDWFSLRTLVLARDIGSELDFELLPCIYPPRRLRDIIYENREVNIDVTPQGGRSLRFYDYCQDGMVALQPISRILEIPDALVEAQVNLPTATTNTNPHDPSLNTQSHGSHLTEDVAAVPAPTFANDSTTVAANDAAASRTTSESYTPLEMRHLESADTGVIQEVRNFLKKPYKLAAGNFTTGNVIGTPVYTQSRIFGTVLRANPIWYNKVLGNYAVRGKLVFTLFVNGNRFQQGRYLLTWTPDGGAFANSAAFIAGHQTVLTQRTQLPHVEIDVNMDTQATIEIPFINATGWAYLQSSLTIFGNDIGTIAIWPYAPLVAPTGSVIAPWALYVHIEDFDMRMPTVPQSRANVRTKVKRRATPASSESSAAGIGPVETSMMAISTAAGVLSGIPLLSSIAAPVKWASDIGASIASVFGWSKPRIQAPFCQVARWIFPKYNNADTPDTSFKLSVMDNNEIETLPGFAGTDFDEMSFGYIATIPAFYQAINWALADGIGATIFTQGICPHDFVNTYAFGLNNITYATPVAFVSDFFYLWRGSLKFTIKIVKTEFHSGRLSIVFLPYDFLSTQSNANAGGVVSEANAQYLHREIVDIREGNEFTFSIPYMSITQYKPTVGTDRYTGNLYISVLNPLVAPANVASFVTVLVEVSAGEDFEVAYPKAANQQPIFALTPQARIPDKEIMSEHLGNSSMTHNLTPAKTCIGERVMSFRTYLKRFQYNFINTAPAVNTYFLWFPFFMGVSYINVINVLNAAESAFDPYAWVGSCFALARGSARWKLLDSGPTDSRLNIVANVPFSQGVGSITNYTFAALPFTSIGGAMQYGVAETFNYTNISGGAEVEFPMYGRSFSYPIADVCSNKGLDMSYDATGLAPRTVGQASWSTAPSGVNPLRALGEDAEFGLFVSVPGTAGWTFGTSN